MFTCVNFREWGESSYIILIIIHQLQKATITCFTLPARANNEWGSNSVCVLVPSCEHVCVGKPVEAHNFTLSISLFIEAANQLLFNIIASHAAFHVSSLCLFVCNTCVTRAQHILWIVMFDYTFAQHEWWHGPQGYLCTYEAHLLFD